MNSPDKVLLIPVLALAVCVAAAGCIEETNNADNGDPQSSNGDPQPGPPPNADGPAGPTGRSPAEQPTSTGGATVVAGGEAVSLQEVLDSMPETAIPRAKQDPARWTALEKQMAARLTGKTVTLDVEADVRLETYETAEGVRFMFRYSSGYGPNGGPGPLAAVRLKRGWLELPVQAASCHSQPLTREQADRIFGEPDKVRIGVRLRGAVKSCRLVKQEPHRLMISLTEVNVPNLDAHLDKVVQARKEAVAAAGRREDAASAKLAADVDVFADDFYAWLMQYATTKNRKAMVKFVRQVAGVDELAGYLPKASGVDEIGRQQGIFGSTQAYGAHQHDLESGQHRTQLVRRGADLSVLLDHPSYKILSDETRLAEFVSKRTAESKSKHGYSLERIRRRRRGE